MVYNDMKFYKIGKLASMLGVTTMTLRNWYKNGKIEAIRTAGGQLLFSENVLYKFGFKTKKHLKINYGYCRVSSNKQKDDLERQLELVKLFLSQKNKEYRVITDIGSGINYKKAGLLELIDIVQLGGIETLVIANKDRLIRFGYELIEYICNKNGTRIEVIDTVKNKTGEQELVDDLISIVTVFSARINGKRSHIKKKLLEDLNALCKKDKD